jgi:DNA adenine methylase
MPLIACKHFEKKNINNIIENFNIKDLQPFLKWSDGKTQILEPIFQKFPKTIEGNYYEIFAGAGTVFLELIKKHEQEQISFYNFNCKKPRIHINDINTNLIYIYQSIKYKPNELKTHIKTYKDMYHSFEKLNNKQNNKKTDTKKLEKIKLIDIKTKEEYYYFMRKRFNEIKDLETNINFIERAALLYFLNKTCFKGVYRENSDGEFNVPFGNYNNISMFSSEQIDSLNYYFNKYNVQFYNMDFRDFIQLINKNDFVYIDPPYFPATLKFEMAKTAEKYKYLNGIWKPISKKNLKYIINFETKQPVPTGESKKVFTSYNKDLFGLKEQEDLVKIITKFNKDEINYLVSNSCADWILENYKKSKIDKILCKRKINSKNPTNKDYEVLISRI